MFVLLSKILLLVARSRQGRRMLFLVALGIVRLVRSPPARRAYATAWRTASDPRPRKAAGSAVRSAGRRARRRG